jgi:hypothetical protein
MNFRGPQGPNRPVGQILGRYRILERSGRAEWVWSTAPMMRGWIGILL